MGFLGNEAEYQKWRDAHRRAGDDNTTEEQWRAQYRQHMMGVRLGNAVFLLGAVVIAGGVGVIGNNYVNSKQEAQRERMEAARVREDTGQFTQTQIRFLADFIANPTALKDVNVSLKIGLDGPPINLTNPKDNDVSAISFIKDTKGFGRTMNWKTRVPSYEISRGFFSSDIVSGHTTATTAEQNAQIIITGKDGKPICNFGLSLPTVMKLLDGKIAPEVSEQVGKNAHRLGYLCGLTEEQYQALKGRIAGLEVSPNGVTAEDLASIAPGGTSLPAAEVSGVKSDGRAAASQSVRPSQNRD